MAPTAPKKKKTGKRIALITAVLAVVAAAAVAVVMFVLPMLKTVETPPYALYIKENQLVFTDLETREPFEITEDLTWQSSSDGVNPADAVSPMVRVVGNRIFYIDGGKEEALGAPLYFRRIDDLDAEPVEVDSAVCSYLVTEDGKTLLYLTAEEFNENLGSVGTLYRYDIATEDAEKLASDVYEFQASPDGENIYYSDSEERNHLLYGGTKSSLPEGSSLTGRTKDLSIVYYVTEDNTLCRMKNGGDAETICENFNGFCALSEDGGRFFYSTLEESARPLSDFLVDDTADGEPPVEPTSPEAPVYSDYARGDGGIDWDAYNAAYEEYCVQRDAYNEAYNDYRQQLDAYDKREELLEDAANELSDREKVTWYFYDNRVSTKLAEGYITAFAEYFDYRPENSLLVYTVSTVETLPKIPLSTVDSVWDLGSKIDAAFAAAEATYVAIGGTAVKLTDDAVSNAVTAENGTIYYTKYTESLQTYTLYKTTVNGNTLGKAETVDTLAKSTDVQADSYLWTSGSAVLYGKNVIYDEDSDEFFGDLYIDGTKIGKNVPPWEWESNADGSIALFADYDRTVGFGTLYLYRDGNATKVADRVSDFAWSPSGELLYLCNVTNGKGDLCVYADGAATEIDSEVQAIVPPYGGTAYIY